jgi:hypothetical protein
MQENSKVPSQQTGENEIDLGVFFHLIANIFRKLGGLIKSFFVAILKAIIFILLFIKRRIVWLLLGALAGLTIGLYVHFSKGPTYFSDMVVRSNFESPRLLYNQVDYYNSLISQRRSKDLAEIFNIKPTEAVKLLHFDISPIDGDLEAAKMYRNTFLDYRRGAVNGVDTQWTHTIKFIDFKKELKEYDYPLQDIRLYSSSPDLFTKVQQGIIQSVSNNKTLQAIKNTSVQIQGDEERILVRSLNGIDSLRQAYNKRIMEVASAAKNQGNNVIVSDKDFRNPEIDLYDKELVLKDELVNSRRKAIEQSDILQVYSDFNPSGTAVSGYKLEFVKYTWWGLLLSFGVVLVYELLKYLDQLEKKKKR